MKRIRAFTENTTADARGSVVSVPTRKYEREEAKYGCDLAFLLASEGLDVIDTIGRHHGTARTWAQLVTLMQGAE